MMNMLRILTMKRYASISFHIFFSTQQLQQIRMTIKEVTLIKPQMYMHFKAMLTYFIHQSSFRVVLFFSIKPNE